MTGAADKLPETDIATALQPHLSSATLEEHPRRLRSRQPTHVQLSLEQLGTAGSRPEPDAAVKGQAVGPRMAALVSKPSVMSRPSFAASGLLPVPRLTRTGRISKAKKGIRGAHICFQCGKGYSRAEHLRRHKQNHEAAKLACEWPHCGKAFSRQDLLDRHVLKHTESRRPSMCSLNSASASAYETEELSGSSGADSDPVLSSSEETQSKAQLLHLQPQAGEVLLSGSSRPEVLSSVPDLTAPLAPTDALALLPQVPPELISESGPILQIGHPNYVTFTHPSPPPWNPLSQFAPTTTFEPQYIPFQDYASEASWSTFPSNSVSPGPVLPQLFSWPEVDPLQFPSSIASSPASRSAYVSMKMGSQVTGSVPYPLPWNSTEDDSGTLDLTGGLEEQHLGQYLNLKKKQHYIDEYWTTFHPLFPILHKQTYLAHKSNPLFSAAVMAIGAQYSNVPFAKSDSRILYEKCRELITKHQEFFKTDCSLAYMQAIFLIELLSHFKAKRAPSELSAAFVGVQQQLWLRHDNLHAQSVGKSQLDDMLKIRASISEQDLAQRWSSWLDAHSYERLLVACYILESQQALLIVKPNQPARVADNGLGLYLPVSCQLWDSSSPNSWARRVCGGQASLTTDVCQTLDEILNGTYTTNLDEFQSSLLTSCHASSQLLRTQEISPYIAQSHAIFTPQNLPLLESVLSMKPAIQMQHQVALLASCTPFEALLAASGESWVLSHRLSSSALPAKERFETLKTSLRLWAGQITSSTSSTFSIYPHTSALEQLSQPAAGTTPEKSAAYQALHCALKIVSLSMTTPQETPMFGPEMALYYAALVLWAVTYPLIIPSPAATLPPVEISPAITIPSPTTEMTSQQPSGPKQELIPLDLSPAQAESTVRAFLDTNRRNSIVVPTTGLEGLPTTEWQFPVGAVMRWTGWVLQGGESGSGASGVGELMEGAVCVLERLGRRGWTTGWF